MKILIIVIIFFTAPAVLIWLTGRYSFLNKIGVVVMSYLFGALMSLLGLLPDNFGEVQDILTTILIPISIPLLLFSTDVRSLGSIANSFIKSMFIAIFATTITVVAGYYLFMTDIPGGNKISGMMLGLYTGGTPNLASIKTALNVDASTYLVVNTADLALGSMYLLFFITVAQRLLNKFLQTSVVDENNDYNGGYTEHISIMSNFVSGQRRKSALVLSLSVLVFAIGGGLSLFFPKGMNTIVAILSITTFSIIISFYKPVNKLKQSFSFGMYLILVFSIVVASMVSIDGLMNTSIEIFLYLAWVIIGTFSIQILLSYFFKIDTDVVIITATALSMSPPFVPVVAGALNNKNIIAPGILVGLIGYIIGNYLGIIIAYIL